MMAFSNIKKPSFEQELVLNQWILRILRCTNFSELKERLGESRFEGLGSGERHTKFYLECSGNLFNENYVKPSDFCRYDQSIVTHWKSVTKNRTNSSAVELDMKCFQYLALLFTEVYLDWYFNRKKELLNRLNNQVSWPNEKIIGGGFLDYEIEDLNKLAYSCAPGSGKTLLLHVNYLQYLKYFNTKNPKNYINRIILLTPNEGLSRWHLSEFVNSGIHARIFNKNQIGDSHRNRVDIIEITKILEKPNEASVALDSFEGNNLVFVDECFRVTGNTGRSWMSRLAALTQEGFSFEYSSSFNQSGAKKLTFTQSEWEILDQKAKKIYAVPLRRLLVSQRDEIALDFNERRKIKLKGSWESYAKRTLFNYNYKCFHSDGYGKDHRILNLNERDFDECTSVYFNACLLSFYQQLWLFDTYMDEYAEFNIEKPLWIFLGNTVDAEYSDIKHVMNILAEFLNNSDQSISWISDLLRNSTPLLDSNENSIFENQFLPLINREPDEIYQDILQRVFNSNGHERLKLVNSICCKGEIALSIGDCSPFGVLNFGNDTNLFTSLSELPGIDFEVGQCKQSLFNEVNDKDSPVNLLIGFQKYFEGWSSCRVSSMGLLNVETEEALKIFQIFGKGTQLKGRNLSLQRSQPNERKGIAYLDKLETLNVFGIQAKYMTTFKSRLKEVGLIPNDEIVQLDFKTQIQLPLKTKLKTLKLKDGYEENQKNGFKQNIFLTMFDIPDEFQGKVEIPTVSLDMHAHSEVLDIPSLENESNIDTRERAKISTDAMEFFCWDQIAFELQKYKRRMNYSNLTVNKNKLIEFCKSSYNWYTLYKPKSELNINSYSGINEQEKILISLLKEYMAHYYNSLKLAYEVEFFETDIIVKNSRSLMNYYEFGFEDSNKAREDQQMIEELKNLAATDDLTEEKGSFSPFIEVSSFNQQLSTPLFYLRKKPSIPLWFRPSSLDSLGEVEFVRNLRFFYNYNNCTNFNKILSGKSLYLLRNADNKYKGLGFALARNFHPDFLLWIVDDKSGKQWLNLIDPKGLRNADITSDPKFSFYREIKKVEAEIGDNSLTLNAFILSQTEYSNLVNITKLETKEELEDRHILFMEDGKFEYLNKLFARILGRST